MTLVSGFVNRNGTKTDDLQRRMGI